MIKLEIGGKIYREILVTDSASHLLVSITDKNIIEGKNCKVVCVPVVKINRDCFCLNYLD